MPPKGSRGGRAASAASAASGRTSSRIAAKQTEAQQLAVQAAEAAVNAPAPAPAPDSSMPPPASTARATGRARGGRGNAEPVSRRGTARGPRGARGGGSVAGNDDFSVAPRNTPYSDDTRNDGAILHTPQSATAGPSVYGSPYSKAPESTPRTKNATANLMNKFVDRLFASSKDILSHFAINAEERDEAWVHELRTHKEVFNQYYKVYTMGATPFIDIVAVSKVTRSHDNDNESLWQKMTQTVAIANLANLLSDVEDLNKDHQNVFERTAAIQRIDDNFPLVFIPGGRDGLESQNGLIDAPTVKQAFAIRAQLFIETLRASPQEFSLRVLAKVFFDVDCERIADDMVEQNIRGAGYRPFIGFDINAPESQEYRDEISSFHKILTQMQPDAAIARLEYDEGEYSFDRFLAGMKYWIRTSESNVPVPGSHHPPALFADSNRDSHDTPGAQLLAESSAPRFDPSGIRVLQQRLSAQQTQENSQFMDDDVPYHDYDDSSMAETNLDVFNASREQPILDADNAGSMYAAAAAQTLNGGRKRGRKNPGDGNNNAKRTREAAAVSASAPATAPVDPNAPPGPSQAVFDPLALSQAAQLISKANRRPAAPKARRPWTVHDTQQLVTAIDVYKAKWSTIEKAIQGHHIAFNVIERDQQGLRDKARLVKVDILKTDAPLPPSFDLVVLGRKEKDMVINAGKNPNRREADVDIAGNPLNTLYNPNAPTPPPSVQQQPAAPLAPEVAADDVDEANDLRPLQEEAQMAMDTHMRGGGTGNGTGVPDAPMMTAADDGQTHVSESLGEGGGMDDDGAPPIDPSMTAASG